MTAAQDEGEWRKTVEQGVERFMGVTAAEKVRAGLRHAVVGPNVGRAKDRIAQTSMFELVRSP